MASNAELTAQIVSFHDQIITLNTRLSIAEQNALLQAQGGSKGGGGDSGVFDKKRLYPKDLQDGSSFRSWSERFLAWVTMDNEEIGKAFLRAGKQESALDVSGLTQIQASYSKAIYAHLRAPLKGFAKRRRLFDLSAMRMASKRGGSLCASLTPRTLRYMRRNLRQ